jgi:hypothetical protein
LADSSTAGGEAVVVALSTLLGSPPFTRHQTLLLQMAKNGVDGAILPVQGAFGAREDALADAIAVARPVAEDIQDDQIVRARRQVSRELITLHNRYMVVPCIIRGQECMWSRAQSIAGQR